ncbi:MAG: exodeoxyribonuclease VII small subunit [SAR324 cluster bacterium]|nr:exodeoxyribonuclease VII small subunit [SAR324 cluster bacterium]
MPAGNNPRWNVKVTATFEENLEALEQIVQSLEEGTATLDESLKAFEKGIKLSRTCQKELSRVEKKVEILVKENDEIKDKEPFED